MAAKPPPLFIVMLPYCTGMHVRGIYRPLPDEPDKPQAPKFVLVRRALTSKPMDAPANEFTWHSVRKGTGTTPLRMHLHTLPEEAKPFPGPLPRIGFNGMLRDRHEAHMKNRSSL